MPTVPSPGKQIKGGGQIVVTKRRCQQGGAVPLQNCVAQGELIATTIEFLEDRMKGPGVDASSDFWDHPFAARSDSLELTKHPERNVEILYHSIRHWSFGIFAYSHLEVSSPKNYVTGGNGRRTHIFLDVGGGAKVKPRNHLLIAHSS